MKHGTRSRYNNLGCRCSECRQANAAYVKTYRKAGSLLVAIPPAAKAYILDSGESVHSMGRRIGVAPETLRLIRTGVRQRVTEAVAKQLLEL